MPDSSSGKLGPVELLAGIDLAAGSNVRVGYHAFRPYTAAHDDIAAQRSYRAHLLRRKFRISVLVAGILDLDTDGAGVDVRLTRPVRGTSMPSPRILGHHLRNPPGFVDNVVARHVAHGI